MCIRDSIRVGIVFSFHSSSSDASRIASAAPDHSAHSSLSPPNSMPRSPGVLTTTGRCIRGTSGCRRSSKSC
eukprot:4633999-Pyramimonas_sp.AAC.1